MNAPMTRLILVLLASTLILGSCVPLLAAEGGQDAYENQVVLLDVTYQTYDEDRPWTKRNPQSRSAAAVVIPGPWLLTEAQLVADATLIQVSKHGSAQKVPAHVAHIDMDADLALLEVREAGFFDDLAPVSLAREIPREGKLNSVRWRKRQLEVSASRVSRLEVEEPYYGYFSHIFLFLRTDLSGGGWSEPVFDGERLAGLSVSQNEQVVRVLPAPVIQSYLDALTGSRPYGGLPALKLMWQTNRDPALTAYLGLRGEPRGVLLREIPWGATGWGVLEPRDILLSLDGHAIDADGYYIHPRYGRLRFTNIPAEGHKTGDRIPAVVWRDGRRKELEIVLRPYPTAMQLIPWRRSNQPPAFLIAGGLLFRELDGEYLRTWGKDWKHKAPSNLTIRWSLARHSQDADHRRIIILSAVIPDDYNVGYHALRDLEVTAVNGRPIDSIADLVEAFAHPVNGFHTVSFYPNMARTELVLDAREFEAATRRILQAYNLPLSLRLDENVPSPWQGDGR